MKKSLLKIYRRSRVFLFSLLLIPLGGCFRFNSSLNEPIQQDPLEKFVRKIFNINSAEIPDDPKEAEKILYHPICLVEF